MFGKKRCRKCGEKVSDNYNYCPYCRSSLKDEFEDEDWGMLGKNDFMEPNMPGFPLGLNSLFNSLLKNLNSQMKDLGGEKAIAAKEKKASKKTGGISISISTSGDKPPEIKVRSFGNMPEYDENGNKNPENLQKKVRLPSSDVQKFSGLPKKEPETNIRRFSNKVAYEIKLPGVKTVKDISIAQLENSIEIKALAGKKVFYKIIPINLPISKYDLSNGILTLELDSIE